MAQRPEVACSRAGAEAALATGVRVGGGAEWTPGAGGDQALLGAIEEALSVYRELAEVRPDDFQPYLATSLNNLSNRLGEMGRREEALDAIEDAVRVYGDLAEARPDAFVAAWRSG